MKKNKFSILIILVIFFITGCAIKTPIKPKAVSFTAITPIIKISDVGFLKLAANTTTLQIYSSGVSLLELSIKDKICINGVCKDELIFNEEFFSSSHYRGFFNNILKKEPIYSGKNLVKTNCGFEQNLSHLTYKICNNKTFYKDTKNGVKIVVREMD